MSGNVSSSYTRFIFCSQFEKHSFQFRETSLSSLHEFWDTPLLLFFIFRYVIGLSRPDRLCNRWSLDRYNFDKRNPLSAANMWVWPRPDKWRGVRNIKRSANIAHSFHTLLTFSSDSLHNLEQVIIFLLLFSFITNNTQHFNNFHKIKHQKFLKSISRKSIEGISTKENILSKLLWSFSC